MKLYWGLGTCAIGIHILLEEVDRPYETERIDVSGGATRTPAFLAVNPKGKVPTLVRDDGSVLTEFSAIATRLAGTNPDTGLMSNDPDAEARMFEAMAYFEGTIHSQGYGRSSLGREPPRRLSQSWLPEDGSGHTRIRSQLVCPPVRFAFRTSAIGGKEHTCGCL